MVDRVGIEPTYPGCKPGALPLSERSKLVCAKGFEPSALCSQGRCSRQAELHADGVPRVDRTPTPGLGNQAPVQRPGRLRKLVSAEGVEPIDLQFPKLAPWPLGYTLVAPCTPGAPMVTTCTRRALAGSAGGWPAQAASLAHTTGAAPAYNRSTGGDNRWIATCAVWWARWDSNPTIDTI